MRKFLFLAACCFFFAVLPAQNKTETAQYPSSCQAAVGTVYRFNPGIAPQFPGGDSALQQFVREKLSLPKKLEKEANGKVMQVRFNIDSTGKVCNVQKGGSTNPKLDDAVVSLFCSMPAWKPGGESADGKTITRRLAFSFVADVHFKVMSDSLNKAAWVNLYRLPNFRIIPPKETSAPFLFAQQMPHFPSEQGDISAYLSKNIHYPDAEKAKKQQGTVYISFIVEKDGSITSVDIVKDIPEAPGLAEEAMKVIGNMPPWTPGSMNGKPVRVQMTIPIKFMLQ